MDESRAVTIVSALADGVNPLTGEVFPIDSPYQSADVVRALYVARRALEARAAGRRRSGGPANAGKPWTDEQDQQLLAEFDQGKAVQDMAKALGRTVAGVQVRLVKLGRVAQDPSNSLAFRWRRTEAHVAS